MIISDYLPSTMAYGIGQQVDDLLLTEQVDLLVALYRKLVENASAQDLIDTGLCFIFDTDKDDEIFGSSRN